VSTIKISNALYKVENIRRNSARMTQMPRETSWQKISCDERFILSQEPKIISQRRGSYVGCKHFVAKHCGMQFAAIDFMVSSPHTAPKNGK